MPAIESAIQSHGTPQTYRLRGHGQVSIRNGCAVDERTRHTLTTSDETASWLLKNAVLTEDERFDIETKWQFVWPNAGSTRTAANMASSDKIYQVFEKRGEAA